MTDLELIISSVPQSGDGDSSERKIAFVPLCFHKTHSLGSQITQHLSLPWQEYLAGSPKTLLLLLPNLFYPCSGGCSPLLVFMEMLILMPIWERWLAWTQWLLLFYHHSQACCVVTVFVPGVISPSLVYSQYSMWPAHARFFLFFPCCCSSYGFIVLLYCQVGLLFPLLPVLR